MKTKTIILSLLIALFAVTVADTKTGKNPKTSVKQNSSHTKVYKGLAMEDRNQFN